MPILQKRRRVRRTTRTCAFPRKSNLHCRDET